MQLITVSGFGQTVDNHPPPGVSFDGNLVFFRAIGEFGENMPQLGFGISINGGYMIKPNIKIGGNFDYIHIGSKNRDIPFNYFSDAVKLKENTSSKNIMTHLLFRIQPHVWFINPYAEGLIGLKFLSTSTEITGKVDGENQTISENNNLWDWGLSYGAGGGIMVKIPFINNDFLSSKTSGTLYINLGFRQFYGSDMEYINPDNIETTDPESGPVSVIFNPYETKTDFTTYTFGIAILF